MTPYQKSSQKIIRHRKAHTLFQHTFFPDLWGSLTKAYVPQSGGVLGPKKGPQTGHLGREKEGLLFFPAPKRVEHLFPNLPWGFRLVSQYFSRKRANRALTIVLTQGHF